MFNISKGIIKSAFGAAVIVLAAAGPGMAQTKHMLSLTVGYDGFSMTTIPMQYALAKGYFKDEGVKVDDRFVAGGSVLTQAVIGGSVELAQNGYSSAIAAAVAGAHIKIIAGISNILPFVIVGQHDIKTFKDLKGKTIAVSKLGSSTDASARMAMAHFGMKPTDITILQLGGEGSRTAAFKSGQVAANVLQYPLAQDLIDDGANLLVKMTDLTKDYPNTAYVTTEAFLKKPNSQEAIARYFRGLARGMRGMREHPAEAAAIAAKFLKQKQTPNFNKAVEYYSNDVYSKDLQPTLPGIQVVLNRLSKKIPAAKTAKPSNLVDTTIVDKLKKEGAFKND